MKVQFQLTRAEISFLMSLVHDAIRDANRSNEKLEGLPGAEGIIARNGKEIAKADAILMKLEAAASR